MENDPVLCWADMGLGDGPLERLISRISCQSQAARSDAEVRQRRLADYDGSLQRSNSAVASLRCHQFWEEKTSRTKPSPPPPIGKNMCFIVAVSRILTSCRLSLGIANVEFTWFFWWPYGSRTVYLPKANRSCFWDHSPQSRKNWFFLPHPRVYI